MLQLQTSDPSCKLGSLDGKMIHTFALTLVPQNTPGYIPGSATTPSYSRTGVNGRFKAGKQPKADVCLNR